MSVIVVYEVVLIVRFIVQVNECGITHFTLGDGGNYENSYVPWNTQYATPSGVPDWTAFRESSFGVGQLTIFNATHAK